MATSDSTTDRGITDSGVEVAYIRGLGVAYFLYGLVGARTMMTMTGTTAAIFVGFVIMCLCASIFFWVVAFRGKGTLMVQGIALSKLLAGITLLMTVFSFITAWSTGLIPVLGMGHPWGDIFSYGGLLIILALLVHQIWSMVRK